MGRSRRKKRNTASLAQGLMELSVGEPATAVDDAAAAASSSSATAPKEEEFSLDNRKYLPKRPKGGTVGTETTVVANCWDLEVNDTEVYRYDIQPLQLISSRENEEKVLKLAEKALYKFTKHIIEELDGNIFSDGRRFVYSPTQLNLPSNADDEMVLFLPAIEGPGLKLKYKIKEVGSISTSDIEQYLSDSLSSTDDLPQDPINMLDTLLKWINIGKFDVIKTCLIGKKIKREIEEKCIQIFDGFSISARPQWKLRINVDLTHKAFFPPGNLAELLYQKYGDGLYDPAKWDTVAEYVKQLQVEAKHYKNPENGMPYSRRLVVHGLSTETADKLMIPELNVTVEKYLKNQYGIELEYPDLPCIKIKKEKDEFLPMELLTVLPFQNAREDVGTVASEIGRVVTVGPKERFKRISQFIKQAITQSDLTQMMGLRISSTEAVKVKARVLPQPVVTIKGEAAALRKGSWFVNSFLQPVSDSVKYAILEIPSSRDYDYSGFKSKLETSAFRLGLKLQTDYGVLVQESHNLKEKFVELRNEGVQLVICILTENRGYAEIKRACEIETFMVTQCIKFESLEKKFVCDNILLKINGKLGGRNWSIGPVTELANKWRKEVVMVVGADVTHPAPTGSSTDLKTSVAAVVASTSSDYMKYIAIVRQQNCKVDRESITARECIDEMQDIFRQLLEKFNRINNKLPTKILFYRDGVSEGQFKQVVVNELGAMKKACRNMRPDYEPGFTFIVVQKRHRIRLFVDSNKDENVQPGTVVDSEITHHREFDFFLCSQQGIKGTSKPVHYHVIYDDNELGSDELQLFTYYLCHAYMRCARSVSYPAPTYYSHLAAFRARVWLKDVLNPNDVVEDNKFKVLPQQQELMYFL